MRVLDPVVRVLSEHAIRSSSKFALLSALLAVILKVTDDELKWDYLKDTLPNASVFGIFASSTSFFLVFRSVQSFNMYREGARNVFQMSGSWFDSASTLMAFTRNSTADDKEVMNFRTTLVRLYSLLSMLCLTELENCEDAHRSQAIRFAILDLEKLDKTVLEMIKSSQCKVEAVFQIIQCLIVDHINTGVLTVPPPILSRAFQDLGTGMLKYHETLNISHTPAPFPLKVMTALLLFVTAVYTPLMMAVWNPTATAAAWTTFIQVLVFFTLNSLADEVENPFSGDRNDVDIQSLHYDMNQRLLELFKTSQELTRKQVTSSSDDISGLVSNFELTLGATKSEKERTKAKRKTAVMKSVIDGFIHKSGSSYIGAKGRASRTHVDCRLDTDAVLTRRSTGPSFERLDLPPDREQECTSLDQVPQSPSLESLELRELNNESNEYQDIPNDLHGFDFNSPRAPMTPPLTP